MGGPDERSDSPVLLDELQVHKAWQDFNILNDLPNPYYLIDFTPSKSCILWASRAACKLLGMPLEKLQGLNLNGGNSAATQLEFALIHEKVQLQLENLDKERAVYPGGKKFHYLWRCQPCRAVLPDAAAPTTLALVAWLPVEENEKDLNLSAEQLPFKAASEVMRHMPSLSSMFDMEHAAHPGVYMCLKSQSFYSGSKVLPPGEPESINWDNLDQSLLLKLEHILDSCVWEDLDRGRAQIEQQLAELQIGDEELSLVCRKRTLGQDEKECQTWHKLVFIPVFHPFAAVTRRCLLVNEFDITIERMVRADLSLAVQAQAALKDFVAAVSHELRTPLNGILGLSDSLSTTCEAQPAVHKSLRMIHQCGLRLKDLVGNIVDVTSIGRGEMKLNWTMVDIPEIAQRVCDSLKEKAKRNVVLCNQVPSSGIPLVDGDRNRLQQVLYNLIGNALKFTTRGTVTISAQLKSGEQEELEVIVADTGCGIPAERMEAVWKPFTQVDMSGTRHYDGVGLGLSIVKEVIEAMGGTINIDSTTNPPSGTTFTCTIPTRRFDSDVTQRTGSGSVDCRDAATDVGPASPSQNAAGVLASADATAEVEEIAEAHVTSSDEYNDLMMQSRRQSMDLINILRVASASSRESNGTRPPHLMSPTSPHAFHRLASTDSARSARFAPVLLPVSRLSSAGSFAGSFSFRRNLRRNSMLSSDSHGHLGNLAGLGSPKGSHHTSQNSKSGGDPGSLEGQISQTPSFPTVSSEDLESKVCPLCSQALPSDRSVRDLVDSFHAMGKATGKPPFMGIHTLREISREGSTVSAAVGSRTDAPSLEADRHLAWDSSSLQELLERGSKSEMSGESRSGESRSGESGGHWRSEEGEDAGCAVAGSWGGRRARGEELAKRRSSLSSRGVSGHGDGRRGSVSSVTWRRGVGEREGEAPEIWEECVPEEGGEGSQEGGRGSMETERESWRSWAERGGGEEGGGERGDSLAGSEDGGGRGGGGAERGWGGAGVWGARERVMEEMVEEVAAQVRRELEAVPVLSLAPEWRAVAEAALAAGQPEVVLRCAREGVSIDDLAVATPQQLEALGAGTPWLRAEIVRCVARVRWQRRIRRIFTWRLSLEEALVLVAVGGAVSVWRGGAIWPDVGRWWERSVPGLWAARMQQAA